MKPKVLFIEMSAWSEYFVRAIRRHYTGSMGPPPGKKVAWRIVEQWDGTLQTVGWIGLGEPAYKLAPRRRIGLQDARPLDFTVCCFIYRIEGPHVVSARDILRLWHPVASEVWSRRYGWSPVHWETMIGQGDTSNPGACFKRSGYRSLGMTTGRSARRPAGHSTGPRIWMDSTPKLVLYRGPLHRGEG